MSREMTETTSNELAETTSKELTEPMLKELIGTVKTPRMEPSNSLVFEFPPHIFTLGLTTTSQPFTVKAILKYYDENQLTGKRNASGKIGETVDFTIDNGPSVFGIFVEPIDPSNSVSGTGTWLLTSR